jgi:hypothetical protein
MSKNKELQIIYITKYCLTKGILTCPGYLDEQYGKYWYLVDDSFSNGRLIMQFKDAFASLEEAQQEAIRIKDKKMNSLRTQIVSLFDKEFIEAKSFVEI